MNTKKLKYLIDIILYYMYIKQTHPDKGSQDKYNLYIPFTEKSWQTINRLVEKSGVKDKAALLSNSLRLFDLIISHEMNGGSVKLIEPNGVNGENINLLDHINGKVDWWKDE